MTSGSPSTVIWIPTAAISRRIDEVKLSTTRPGGDSRPTQSTLSGPGLLRRKLLARQSKSGFDIWRFRLVRSPSENPVTNPKPGVPPSGNQRREYATTQRLVRNTAVTQWVKQLYGYQCQVCDVVLHTPTGPYAEGAHLRPVGRPHNGPDEASNVLCLCPNDHVRLDRGVIALTPNGDVVEIETGSTLGQLTIEPNHGLDFAQAAYHRSIHAP